MSKNFARQYRELAQNTAPDLWERIEAGLAETPETSAESAPSEGVRKINEIKEIKEVKEIKTIKGRLLSLRPGRLATAAAALLCAAVLIPAAVILGRNGLWPGMTVSQLEASQEALSESEETAEVTMAKNAEDTMAGMAEDTSAAEAEAVEESAEDTSAAEAEAAVAESAGKASTAGTAAAMADATDTTDTAEAAVEDTADALLESASGAKEKTAEKNSDSGSAGSAAVTESASAEEDGVLAKVQVCILETADIPASVTSAGTCYLGRIVKLPTDSAAKGTEIRIFLPEDCKAELKAGVVYELDLLLLEAASDCYEVQTLYP